MSSKKVFLTLLLIMFIALAFSLPAILNSGSFWFDEIISLKIAQHNIIDSWQYLKWENNPPLHYWFLHFWIKTFSQSEISLRFSSILFNIFNLIAIYFLGKKLFNKSIGLMASFLLAISSFQLFLSMDARMYPMLLFFSILSCYFFWQALKQPNRKNWLFYIIFTLLAFYTHLIGFYLFIIQNLYFIYHFNFINKKQPKILQWTLSQFIILFVFSPWLINFIIRSDSTINSSAWYLHTSGQGFLLFQIPRSFLFFSYNAPSIELIGLIIFGILFILSFAEISNWSLIDKQFKIKLKFTPAIVFSFIIFVMPLFFGFLIQLWVTKYYLVSMIGFLMLLAVGFDNLKLVIRYKFVLILLLIIFFIPYNLNIIKVNRHTWDQVGKYVNSITQPDDRILISAFTYQLPFEHYYQGETEVVAYRPDGLEEDILLRSVKYNWQAILTQENMPEMEQFIDNKKRIIIINPSVVESVHKSNLVVEWFMDNNWHLVHKEQFSGFIQPTVLIFERPDDIL